ncbi:histidinol-phosphatase [Desulfoprunum benzoelyticum]|uniref:Histidinol-phosphatase n=1 Tax=Desulfoprunum benzoelyticum TaxID=1506996 RepID=A0A840V387_9BACT|nr:histidinol-phosphatase [Desulfoprunum benzoelyticum]MBB5347601.1 histidinol-phosphatase (PHP family) [Desulfoprunum benzoelyticum]MBM9529270.1 histidinol-phosphatase [Desulfoprunum benzoelyticum]
MPVPTPAIDISCDGHIHTRLCHHASGEMEDYVRSAIAKGLRKIFFLEHMEDGVNYTEVTWLNEDDFDAYFAEGQRLQRIYHDRIDIGLGVEVGYNPEHVDQLRDRLARRPWDRIGLSFHYARLSANEPHLNLLSRRSENISRAREFGAETLLSRYLDTLIEAVTRLPADVLCHLDAALRYLPELTWTPDHLEQIDILLSLVKGNRLRLEINTSGLPIRGEPFPSSLILRKAINLGIPLVAGSDAHRPEDVGRHFDGIKDHLGKAVSL